MPASERPTDRVPAQKLVQVIDSASKNEHLGRWGRMGLSEATSPDLPVGTVTFFLTDIEGSTRLLRTVGQETFREIVEDHVRILRRAVTAVGGVEVSTEGDAFFGVFESATQAVSAGVRAQRGLAEHPWPDGAVLRVRIGLHTGEGVLGGDNYLGIDVHRAARIAAAGHGGQILLSAATSALAERELPAGTSLRDLGEHRLKDLPEPERIYQLVAADLPADFPALRALDAPATNLPAELTPFIGRDREIEEIIDLLDQARLVTLTGAGGSGKTRLALRVVTQSLEGFADGAFFVPLASITDPGLAPTTIASSLGLAETPDASAFQVVADHLRERELLLLLDNFEQILPAARYVARLLADCPGVSCLVTSRAPLHVAGEQEYPVPALSLPDPLDLPPFVSLSQYDSVALFLARARAVDPHFEVSEDNAPAIAEITTRLDGLPLAIELAAARVKILAPSEILARLDEQRLSLLRAASAGTPDRQQTLRNTIQWSHELLNDADKVLFRHLTVFVGGFTLASAEEIVGEGADVLDGIASLADNSLIRRSSMASDRSRYDMLETIRQFGLNELRSHGELDEVTRRHARHFLSLAEESEPHLVAEDQIAWLDRLDHEHDNLRAAFAWAKGNAPEEGARAAAAVWRYFQFRSHLREGSRLLADLLAEPAVLEATDVRADALVGLAGLVYWRGDYIEAVRLYEEALDIYQVLGDRANIADSLYNLSTAYGMADDYETGRRAAENSLEIWEELGDEVGAARAHASLAWYHFIAGEHETALQSAERAERVFRERGSRHEHATSVTMAAYFTFADGDVDAARPMMVDALDFYAEVDDRTNIAGVLDGLATMAVAEGDVDGGLLLAGAAERIRTEIEGGAPPGAIPMTDPREIAHKTLTDEQIETALEAGRQLTLEEALTAARQP